MGGGGGRVNHRKLFIRYFLTRFKVTLYFFEAGSGSALRKTAGSGYAKIRRDPQPGVSGPVSVLRLCR